MDGLFEKVKLGERGNEIVEENTIVEEGVNLEDLYFPGQGNVYDDYEPDISAIFSKINKEKEKQISSDDYWANMADSLPDEESREDKTREEETNSSDDYWINMADSMSENHKKETIPEEKPVSKLDQFRNLFSGEIIDNDFENDHDKPLVPNISKLDQFKNSFSGEIIDPDEMDEEDRLAQVKFDIRNCRKHWFTKFSGSNGRSISKPLICKHTHGDGSESQPVCQQCLEARGASFREQVMGLIEQGQPVTVEYLTEEQQKRLIRKLGKENVLCLPQLDEETFVVFYEPDGTEDCLSEDELEAINWTEIARQPQGRRISGKLGTEDLEEEETDKFVFSTKYVCTDLPSDLRKVAEELAVWDTVEYNYQLLPENTDEIDADKIQTACNLRCNAFESRVKEMGGKILYTGYHICRVNTDEIDWFTDLVDNTAEKAYARHSISIELNLYRNKMTSGDAEQAVYA